MNKTRTAIGAAALASLLVLTGCGSDSEASSESASDTPSAAPSGGPGGFDSAQLQEIQECLEAAGLEDKLSTERPTDMPSDLPSDMPTDIPSDVPTDLPSDIPSGGPGGGFGALQDPEVQEALDACGIDLPQAPTDGTS